MSLWDIWASESLIRAYNESRPPRFEGRAVGCFFSRIAADMMDDEVLARELDAQNARTHGTIVFERVERSATYFYVSVILALIPVVPVIVLWPYIDIIFPIKFLFMLIVFMAALLGVEARLLRLKLLTKFQKWRGAVRAAKNAFFRHSLDRNTVGAGVLIYLAVFEKRVDILIGPQAGGRRTPTDTWQEIADDLAAAIETQALGNALIATIRRCGDMLATMFPADRPLVWDRKQAR